MPAKPDNAARMRGPSRIPLSAGRGARGVGRLHAHARRAARVAPRRRRLEREGRHTDHLRRPDQRRREPGVTPLAVAARLRPAGAWRAWSPASISCPSTRTPPTTASRVVDFKQVKPEWGSLGRRAGALPRRLPPDGRPGVQPCLGVLATGSRVSCADDPKHRRDLRHRGAPDDPDLSQVTRPRTLPLLTPVPDRRGDKHVWTTFSADQIDLNFNNPEVLLEILDAAACYVDTGAPFIRLDAIAFSGRRRHALHPPAADAHRIIRFCAPRSTRSRRMSSHHRDQRAAPGQYHATSATATTKPSWSTSSPAAAPLHTFAPAMRAR